MPWRNPQLLTSRVNDTNLDGTDTYGATAKLHNSLHSNIDHFGCIFRRQRIIETAHAYQPVFRAGEAISYTMNVALQIDDAYKRGDLSALRRLLGDPEDFPNCRGPSGAGEIILEYAIYHSPLPFIRKLLELGAEPNYRDHAGFPSVVAAVSSERSDRCELVELLIAHGADIHERGINGFTPLHFAATAEDLRMIELLISHGADPNMRTNVDDYTTPLEEAERMGRKKAVEILRKHTQQ